jgi:hypothetical protein
MKSIVLQDAYPSQAEGGLAGDISISLKRALAAWDERRFNNKPVPSYGSAYVREKATKRAEVTWNPTPASKPPTIKVPRAPRPAKVKEPDLPGLSRGQRYRNKMTPEQRETHLARRRAEYRAKAGPPKQRPKMDPDKRRESVKRACRAFRARKKAKKNENQIIIPS